MEMYQRIIHTLDTFILGRLGIELLSWNGKYSVDNKSTVFVQFTYAPVMAEDAIQTNPWRSQTCILEPFSFILIYFIVLLVNCNLS
jgi:hypothetical protein